MATITAEQRISQRFIPKGSVKIESSLAVCYTHETVRPSGKITYSVIAYIGNAGKKCFYESYGTIEGRDKRISEFFAGLESTAKMKAGFNEERSKPHTVKVGDIIHHSWGWEQTQCDYYQVLAVTLHGATIQAIGSETVQGSDRGGMSDSRMPVKDHFVRRCGSGSVEEPLKVRIDGRNCVTTLKHGHATVWDGRAKYCSWYG